MMQHNAIDYGIKISRIVNTKLTLYQLTALTTWGKSENYFIIVLK